MFFGILSHPICDPPSATHGRMNSACVRQRKRHNLATRLGLSRHAKEAQPYCYQNCLSHCFYLPSCQIHCAKPLVPWANPVTITIIDFFISPCCPPKLVPPFLEERPKLVCAIDLPILTERKCLKHQGKRSVAGEQYPPYGWWFWASVRS
jgi:hypothetical protein